MTAPAFAVREALPHELQDAGDVVVEAYRALPGGADAGYLEHVRDAVERARHCPVLVAVAPDGGVLGSVTYVAGPDNPYAEVERADEACFRMLGVAPAAQGLGVGRALVEACIARARADGYAGIAISTGRSMAAAHRLYESLGFVRDPARDWSPVPGVALLVYALRL